MINKILTVLLAASVALLLGVHWRFGQLEKQQLAVVPAPFITKRSADMGTVTVTWVSGGMPVTFTTSRQETETAAEFAVRARAEYEALLLAFPKDL